MSRALLVGSTDYSHQSFEDMVTDLNEWVKNLTQVYDLLIESKAILEERDYWKNISYDMNGYFNYAITFFKTSIEEINSILDDFNDVVQPNHITRIRSLYKTAGTFYRELVIEWGRGYLNKEIEFGNQNYIMMTEMYTQASDMAADMIDLSNLSSRLEDFIGKTGKQKSETAKIQKAPRTYLFINQTRLDQLRDVKSTHFDLIKLIRLCEELNICYINECFLATAMLGRAIIDHVPPIFGCNNFAQVCNNYNGTKSFKESINTLNGSLKNIADHHLHVQIREKECLPIENQVNFIPDLDVLLAEIVRILK